MFLSFLTRAGTYYFSEGHFFFNRKYSFLLLIELNSIRSGGNIETWILAGTHALRFVNVVFPIGIKQL